MFEENIYLSEKNRIIKSPLYRRSALLSLLLHVAALLFLSANPEYVFSAKRFIRDKRDADEAKSRIVTYLYHPEVMYAPPTRRPQGNVYSDRDRTAPSRPPITAPPANRLPFSRGNTPEPAPVNDEEVARRPEPAGTEAGAAGGAAEQSAQVGMQQSDETKRAEAEIKKVIDPQTFYPPEKPLPLEQVAELEASGQTPAKGPGTGPGQMEAKSGPQPAERVFENEQSALRSEGSGFFDTKGFYLGDYAREVVRRIKENWLIPPELQYSRGRATLIFYIERDGQISGLRLVASSGSNLLDRSALQSVLASSPFPPLPQGFPNQHLGAKFIFSYNE